MTWPQIYVLASMILSGAIGIATEARNRDKSSSYVAIYVFLVIAFRVIAALVLHAGGFW